MDTVAMYDGFVSPYLPWSTGFQLAALGPDGKVYFATPGSTTALHVLNRPDLPGTACDVQQHGIILPKFNAGAMHRYPNYRLGEWQASPCDTLPQRPPSSGGGGFTPTPYAPPTHVRTDTGYRLLTPVPDKTQSPDIYFRRKELPNAPEMREWWETMKYEPRTITQDSTRHE